MLLDFTGFVVIGRVYWFQCSNDERTEMLEITEFEAGSGVCPFTEFPADYRVLDGARFCVVCGDDHEAE